MRADSLDCSCPGIVLMRSLVVSGLLSRRYLIGLGTSRTDKRVCPWNPTQKSLDIHNTNFIARGW